MNNEHRTIDQAGLIVKRFGVFGLVFLTMHSKDKQVIDSFVPQLGHVHPALPAAPTLSLLSDR